MGWTLVGHWRLPDKYVDKYMRDDDKGMPSKFRLKVAPKIWYFMVNAGAVFFLPFLGIFWRDNLGYSTSQVGLLQALRPWVSAASGYVLTPIADKWQIHYYMMLATYAIGITSRGLITIGWSFGIMLVLALLMEGTITPMGIFVDATVVAGSNKTGTYGRARLWASIGWGCLAPVAGFVLSEYGIKTCFKIFAGIYGCAFIPMVLVPAHILSRHTKQPERQGASDYTPPEVVVRSAEQDGAEFKGEVAAAKEENQPSSHNNIAATTTAVQASELKRRSSRHHGTGGGSQKEEHTIPVVHISLIAISHTGAASTPGVGGEKAAPSDMKIVKPELTKDSPNQPDSCLPKGILKELMALLARVDVSMFMFKAFLMGVANGFIGYLFLLLSDEGASGLLLGLCLAANCIGEVPIFYFSGAIIKRLGVELSINIAIIAYLLRLAAYAMIPWLPSLWIILPVEVLQGLTFALAWSAGTVHCRDVAPPHLRSSVQSIYSGLYSGVGAGVGGLAGGLLYGAFGGQVMCASGCGVMFVGWVLANGINSISKAMKKVAHRFSVTARFSQRAPPPVQQ